MPIEVKMPALSPTMEEGTLAKWLVSEGDMVKPGDLIAEIETDKATMEVESVDEGRIVRILVLEGGDAVPVGAVIALISEADDADFATTNSQPEPAVETVIAAEDVSSAVPTASAPVMVEPRHDVVPPAAQIPHARLADKVKVSPLAARIAAANGIDLAVVRGSGPNGRIVKADLGLSRIVVPTRDAVTAPPPQGLAPAPIAIADIPHNLEQLSSMRKTIARRLTESKQQVPHIYLTVDICLDALLDLRGQLNRSLAARDIKLSVNDLVIKALALALVEVPSCNVQFAGDRMARFTRADIAVAVSIPNGLITPVIVDAGRKSLSSIADEMRDLASRGREGKLQPSEYQGGTASLSNLGMFGIKQFAAILNPPQAMIMAVGSGDQRPHVRDGSLGIATIMSATGSFDHRAIDGADAADLMRAFKALIEEPLRLVA